MITPETVPTEAPAQPAAAPLPREPFIFRGRMYIRGHVSALQALRIQEVVHHLEKIGEEESPAARDAKARVLMPEAARLIAKHVEPAGLFRRLLWPFTRNPFRKAGPAEMGILLGLVYRGTWASTVKFHGSESLRYGGAS